MKKLMYLILMNIFYINLTLLFANNVDTGWMTFTQPNGVEFTGRGWGDEFEFYWETKDGYRFVKNYDSGYWCYAAFSEKGDFKASDYAVGIVNPALVGIEKNLQFSESYKAEIEKRRQEFEAKLLKIQDEIEQWGQAQTITVTRTVWVDLILVEFDNVRHDPFYTFSDYNTMFASIGVYEGQGSSTPHPDSRRNPPVYKDVYGSVHDYWDDMSNGEVNITGAVWNTAGWITLDYSKSYYHNNSESIFINEIDTKSGYDTSVLGPNHLRAILYAGNEYLEHKTLHPHAIYYGYLMAAEFSRPQNQENPDNFFANIGTHCHELGHPAFGLPDRYGTWTYNQWGLMAVGNKNGPANELACPAPLNPYDRETNGWITFQNFSGTEANKTFVYDYDSPQVFKIAESGNDFFLIENRQKTTGFDRYLPNSGILAWHKFKIYSTTYLDVIEADNIQSSSTQTGDTFPGSTNNKHLNDFTSPNCNYYDGSNSQLVLHDVSTPSTTMYADLGTKWFGDIPINLTWEDDIKIGGDVVVPNNITLSVEEGAFITFDSSLELKINGTLNAQGTSADHITFTSSQTSPQKGDWDWIKFDNSSGTSILEYCDIEYAKFGIWCVSNSQVSMDNVTVTNCQNYGLYLLNNSTNTSVENSSFTNINDRGIFLYNSDPDIVYAICTNNNYGLFCYNNSNPEIGRSIFSNNNYDGIQCVNTGYVWMYYHATYFPNRGWNTIQSNSSRGVSAYSSSYPYMGISQSYPGNNTIKYNSSYEVYNGNSSGWIFAKYNWWDGTPDLYTNQTVIIDPVNTRSVQLTGLSKPTVDNDFVNSTPNSIPEEYNLIATTFLMEGNYEKARGLFQYVIENYPDSEEAKYALVNLTACFDQLNESSNVVPYLEGVSENYSKLDLSGFALALSVPYLESAGNYSQAVERCLQVREFSKDEEVNKNLLFIMANIHFYGLQDAEKAKLYFEEYINNYPKDPMTKTAQDMLEIMDHRFIPKRDDPEKTQANNSPTTFVLSQNYPNPFNPETEISFQIPNKEYVSLVVYNLLGQRIRTLVDKEMPTGYHTIKWDGRNDFGNAVASGVYLYSIQAGNFFNVKKMVLMQ